ncbi:MAG: glycosyltransferase, partial [Clostridiales bacterium]|nr:glycosyltransferase [Clostridiales bacterium]
MAAISLCMIVKNEEKNLAECLDSVKSAVDEINIVDTGSNDGTVGIAAQYTDRVFNFSWVDDFAAARNFSWLQATKDFVMWLDADDIITPENLGKLLELKAALGTDTDFVIMQYRVHYNDDGSASMIFPKARITRRAMGIQWRGAVHEDLDTRGHGVSVDLYIDHKYKDHRPSLARDARIMKKEIDSGRADYRIHYFYGLVEFYEDHYEEAEKYLCMVAESGFTSTFDPIEVYTALHFIYRRRGEVDKARAILEDNERLMEDKSEYFCCLGLFYADCLNNPEKACELYKQALRRKGTFLRTDIPGQRNPDYYYHIPNVLLGKAYVTLREPEKAAAYFERALEYRKNEEVERLIVKLRQLIAMSN